MNETLSQKQLIKIGGWRCGLAAKSLCCLPEVLNSVSSTHVVQLQEM